MIPGEASEDNGQSGRSGLNDVEAQETKGHRSSGKDASMSNDALPRSAMVQAW